MPATNHSSLQSSPCAPASTTTIPTMNRFSSEAIGTRIEAAARFLAPFLAIAYVALSIAAQSAYDAGRLLRLALHDRATQLAALHVRLTVRTPSAAPAAIAPKPAPAVHPLMLLADDLQELSATALRQMAGIRSKRPRKAELAALLVAC